MRRVFAICLLTGDNFSPKKLEGLSKLQLIDKQEKGEMGKSGFYKGKLIPKGNATLECSFSQEERAMGKNELDTMLQLIIDNYAHITESGVEDIDVTLIIGHTGDGGSWYLKYEELEKITKLGIGLSIDWYQIEDESVYTPLVRKFLPY